MEGAPRTPTTSAASLSATKLRCPPSPVMRAKEGFFQLLRHKKREFEMRLDYEFLWLRELSEEVERAADSGRAPGPALLPPTPTATHKRQRLLLEAREAVRVQQSPSVFTSPAVVKERSSKPSVGGCPSPAPPCRATPALPPSKLGVSVSTAGGAQRRGSIIRSLFTDAAAAGKAKERAHSPMTIGLRNKRVEEDNKENAHDTNQCPLVGADRTPGSPSGALFLPPPNAWLRSPSPVTKVDGRGVIAVRVRKTPLTVAQQNLRKRARELAMGIPLSPYRDTAAACGATGQSPRQELLMTEDNTAVVFRVDPADESSPGVTAECDVDVLRKELSAERLANQITSIEPNTEDSHGQDRVRHDQAASPRSDHHENQSLTTSAMLSKLGAFQSRSASWFTLGTDLSEVEEVVPTTSNKLDREVSRDSVHDSDVETRSFVRVSMEVVGEPQCQEAHRCERSDEEQRGRLTGSSIEEEVLVPAGPPSTLNNQRKSRILEREERLREIDQQREKIKKRREERQRRRLRESEVGRGKSTQSSVPCAEPLGIRQSATTHHLIPRENCPKTGYDGNSAEPPISPRSVLIKKLRERSVRLKHHVRLHESRGPSPAGLTGKEAYDSGDARTTAAPQQPSAATQRKQGRVLRATMCTPCAPNAPSLQVGAGPKEFDVEGLKETEDTTFSGEGGSLHPIGHRASPEIDTLVEQGCETVLTYSSLKEKKLVEAFFEAIAKQKRQREERDRMQTRPQATMSPFPIPAEPKEVLSSPVEAHLPTTSAPHGAMSSSDGSVEKKRKLENDESASSDDKDKKKKESARTDGDRRGEVKWRGEGEGTLRRRQAKEKQENGQRLYGLDAELARKTNEKLQPELVRKAIMWVYKAARGDTRGSVLMPPTTRGTVGLFDCLKSGRLLCEVANNVRPGIVPKVHVRPIPLMEQENIKMYLVACERLGMRKADLFVVSDLYEEKYLPAVLQNIICLSRLASSSPSFSGPRLRA